MFDHTYLSSQYFPAVWFAPGDESHLLPEEIDRGAAPVSGKNRPVILSVPHVEPPVAKTKTSMAVTTLLDLGKDSDAIEIVEPASILQAAAPLSSDEIAKEVSATLKRIKAEADHNAHLLEMVEAEDAAAMMLMLEMMD